MSYVNLQSIWTFGKRGKIFQTFRKLINLNGFDICFRDVAASVSAEQSASSPIIDLTTDFEERLRVASNEDMDPILLEQERIVEAYGFVEDLVNPDESTFTLLEEDELTEVPCPDDYYENIIDEILDEQALNEFNFDVNFADLLWFCQFNLILNTLIHLTVPCFNRAIETLCSLPVIFLCY